MGLTKTNATCGTCRFMAAERDAQIRTGTDMGIEGDSSDTHHSCVRIVHGNGRPRPDAPRDAMELAAVLDGSGYAARLVVLPSFGCVLHEEREEKEVERASGGGEEAA